MNLIGIDNCPSDGNLSPPKNSKQAQLDLNCEILNWG